MADSATKADHTADDLGRYASQPTQIPWVGWKRIVKRSFTQMSDADLGLRCAGVAFYAFLSIFPVLACFVLIYGLVADTSLLQEQLSDLRRFVPASVYEIVKERLDALLSQPQVGLGLGLVVSFAVALWSGSRGTNALMSTISRAYYEDEDRGFIGAAIVSLSLTLGALIFITIALFSIAILPVIVQLVPLPNLVETVALWSRWPLLAGFVVVSLAVLFRFAPNRDDPEWKWVTPGALFATVLWLVLSVLFSIYVEQFGNYSATFGSLSVAVVMMLWLYYSTMVIAFGAALNAEIEHQTKVDTTSGPNAPMGERGAYVADNLPEPHSD